jgi:hypothetical protein
MWAHLNRLGVPVARCTVERLMRENGWQGARRARKVRTTVADPAAERAPDLVKRCFTAARPNQLWVADFTYVPMVTDFGYTAFVIDAFGGRIVGWECSLSKETAFVESAIHQAGVFVRLLPGSTNGEVSTDTCTPHGKCRVRTVAAHRAPAPAPRPAPTPEPSAGKPTKCRYQKPTRHFSPDPLHDQLPCAAPATHNDPGQPRPAGTPAVCTSW